MKQLLFCICAALCLLTARGQDKTPEFGDISRAELEMKECDFEKEAPALVLVDEGRLSFKWNNRDFFRMTLERRVRIKIFSTRGLDYANVTIRYLNDKQYEYISKLEAVTYNLGADGKPEPVKVSKEQMFDEARTSYDRQIKFACPNVKPGSIIEYRYVVTRESFYAISPWVLQWTIPVKTSSYKMEVPDFLKFSLSSMNAYVSETKRDTKQEKFFTQDGGTIDMPVNHTTYLSYNVPSLKEEPFMRCLDDYREMLDFDLTAMEFPDGTRYDYSNSWPRIAGALNKNKQFGGQLEKKVEIPALDNLLKPLTVPFEKMKAIHSYFTQNFSFSGKLDYLCESIKKIAETGKGTSGDINLLLINQLAAAGLEAYPVLMSTRDNGTVKTYFASSQQFNTVMALVVINEREYIIDGTDKYSYTGLIPEPVHNSVGLVIKPEKYALRKFFTPWKKERQLIGFQGSVNEAGQVTGAVTIQSFDYAKTPRVKQLKDDRDKYDAAFLKPAIKDISIQRPSFKNEGNDTLPLQHSFICTFPLEKAGDYWLMPLNLFTGTGEKNPLLSDQRTSEVYFGYSREYIVNGRLNLPDNLALEDTLQPFELVAPDSSLYFLRDLVVEGNLVEFQLGIQFNKPSYPVKDYGFIKNFYKELVRLMGEKLVLRKK